MAQRLFSLNKIPTFLDDYKPGKERRRGEMVKIITLSLRVQPFDSKLATAIDDGLLDDTGVRDALFKIGTPEPKKHRTKVYFNLGCSQQNLILYASTDTPTSRMAFVQCRIKGEYARTSTDVNGFAFCFKASFGPVGKDEMEFIHAWLGGQQAVTFEESEEQFDLDEPADDEDDADDEELEAAPGPKAPKEAPMFGDDDPASNAPISGAQVAEDKNREIGHAYPKKRAAKTPPVH